MKDGGTKKKNGMYGISRVVSAKYRTRAWRVSLTRQGKKLVKNFPDKKYGDKHRALTLARLHRDELLRRYPPTTRKQMCSILRQNNRSGIPGVYSYAKKYTLRSGAIRECRYWEATWQGENYESISACFSVKTYGEDMARQLAIRARKKGVSAISGVLWVSARGVVEPETIEESVLHEHEEASAS